MRVDNFEGIVLQMRLIIGNFRSFNAAIVKLEELTVEQEEKKCCEEEKEKCIFAISISKSFERAVADEQQQQRRNFTD